MIGIEMDSWNPSGHNGKGLFTAADDRGYFAKRSEIIEIIKQTAGLEQSQIQLQRHKQILSLQKRLYKMDQLEKKLRSGIELGTDQRQFLQRKIAVQRQLRDLTEAFELNYPSVEIDDVVRRESSTTLNIPSNVPPAKPSATQKAPAVKAGDRIILDTGDIGKVVFVGSVSFDDREMFGILLDNWSPNGHDGTVDGTQYFVAPEGRGLLVPLESVKDLYDETKMMAKQKKKKQAAKSDKRRKSVELKPVNEDEEESNEETKKDEPKPAQIYEGDNGMYPDLPQVGQAINVGGVYKLTYIHIY
ncbi:hypothetical protein RFI_21287, partial [Reticulomyxa filosa]